MQSLGVFGETVADEGRGDAAAREMGGFGGQAAGGDIGLGVRFSRGQALSAAAPMAAAKTDSLAADGGGAGATPLAAPVRMPVT